MIDQLFNAPSNKYENRVQLQQIEEISFPKKTKKQKQQELSPSKELRLKKLQSLGLQTQQLIKEKIATKFQQGLKQLPNGEYLKVKHTKHNFFGQTSTTQDMNLIFKSKSRVAQGLCQIFFDDSSYLVGEFDRGKLLSEYLYVLPNGNYMKAKGKVKESQVSNSWFKTKDSLSVSSGNNYIDDDDDKDEIEEDGIDFVLTDGHAGSDSNLHCEVLYNGVYYRGSMQKGQLHGHVFQKNRDYQFTGNFSNGQRKYGKLVSRFGFEYQGTFKDNKFDGLGTLTTKEGVYSGEFKNGLKEGDGQFEWKDGSVYKGDFRKDGRHGKGFFKSREGSFKGQWRDDQIQGNGYLIIGNKGVGGQWRKNNYEKPNKYF